MTMINFEKEGIIFNYRVAGITIHDGKLLVYKHINREDSVWAIPGGRVELGESSAESLVREYAEELDAKVKAGRMLWLVENFFERNGKYHEILVVYLVDLPADSDYLKVEEFDGVEEIKKVRFKWVPLNEVKDLDIYPLFIREKIEKLPEHVEHIVNKEY